MLTLFGIVGIAIPKMLNKMIKRDVEKDVVINNSNQNSGNFAVLKQPRMEDFISGKTSLKNVCGNYCKYYKRDIKV